MRPPSFRSNGCNHLDKPYREYYDAAIAAGYNRDLAWTIAYNAVQYILFDQVLYTAGWKALEAGPSVSGWEEEHNDVFLSGMAPDQEPRPFDFYHRVPHDPFTWVTKTLSEFLRAIRQSERP